MNSQYRDEDGGDTLVSLEIKRVSEDVRNKIALRRQRLSSVVEWDFAETGSSPVPVLKESVPADDSEECISLDFTIPQPKTEEAETESVPSKKDFQSIMDELEHMEKDLDAALPAPPVSQQPKTEKNETGIIPPKKNIQAMMEELADMEKDLSVALPTLSFMSPETKKQIMDNIAHQEANWESLHPADIKIDKEEVSMWGGFMGSAKKSDFIGQKVLETLESGEIVDLTINGFESFRIVKIRAKNKDTHAMSVIEFIKKDPKNGRLIKWSGDYLITLPLIEGVSFSILKKETMQPLVTYKIQKMSLNKQQRSLIQKFFDLFI